MFLADYTPITWLGTPGTSAGALGSQRPDTTASPTKLVVGGSKLGAGGAAAGAGADGDGGSGSAGAGAGPSGLGAAEGGQAKANGAGAGVGEGGEEVPPASPPPSTPPQPLVVDSYKVCGCDGVVES